MQERVLIIKHGALGDFVLAMGTMRGIREKHPDAHLALMTMGMFKGIADQMGFFDEIIVDNRVTYWNLVANYKAISSIVDGGFTTVYDLQESSRTMRRYAPLVRFFCRHDYRWYTYRKDCYRIEKSGIGFGKRTEIPMDVPLRMTDLRFLKGKGEHFDELPERFVVLVPGCSPKHPHKRWAVENYCALAKRLAEQGVHSVIIGTKAEEAEINAIAASTPMAVNFMGKNSLLDLPSIAERALACVGNDTGPMHMSAFSKTRTIYIFSNITKATLKVPGFPADAIPLVSPVDNINHVTVDQVWGVLEPLLSAQK